MPENLNDLCRCCHSEGSNLYFETTSDLCTKIKYEDLIMETFGITMLPSPKEIDGSTICNICLTKLQEASTFRQQVVKCEDVFKKLCSITKFEDGEINDSIKSELDCIQDDYDDSKEEIFLEFPVETIDFPEKSVIERPKRKRKKLVAERNLKPDKCIRYRAKTKYKCQLCNLEFIYEKHLINHMSISHSDGAKNSCPTCRETFKNASQLKKHLSIHLNSKKSECPICKKTLKRSNVKEHMKIHGAPRFVCDICGKEFWQQSQLHRHSTVHTGDKPFSCDQCNKSFTRKYTLVVHMRRHTGERPYGCDICNKSFAAHSAYKIHQRLHTGAKPYTCSLCPLSFKHAGSLRVHKRTHTGERPYLCKICGKRFGSASALGPHVRTHTGEKPYQCDICVHAFSEKKALERHMCTHTGIKLHTCKICNKPISALARHMRVKHSGEKPYACSFCDKRFADNRYLKIHLRTHTGERPFACEHCCKRFTQKHVLKNHRCSYNDEANGNKSISSID